MHRLSSTKQAPSLLWVTRRATGSDERRRPLRRHPTTSNIADVLRTATMRSNWRNPNQTWIHLLLPRGCWRTATTHHHPPRCRSTNDPQLALLQRPSTADDLSDDKLVNSRNPASSIASPFEGHLHIEIGYRRRSSSELLLLRRSTRRQRSVSKGESLSL